MDAQFINNTAREILNVINASNWNIRGSWGMHKLKAEYLFNKYASLSFLVQGFDFKGRIWVAYNEGADTYKVFGRKQGQKEPKELVEECFCDNLVDVLDRLIETGKEGKKFYKNAI